VRGAPARGEPEQRYWTVDGHRVVSLAEAVELLNGPVRPPPPTPEELVERELEKLRKGNPPTPADLAKEIAREMRERRRVYLPKVIEGKMTAALMARRIWMMEYLHDGYAREAAKSDLFGGTDGES
jgi:hypothetical protein